MKKLIVTLIFTLSVFSHVSAQFYQSVSGTGVKLFEDASGNVFALRIDSVEVIAGDSVFYPFHQIRHISNDCYTPFGASWIGEKVIVKPGGDNYFFNALSDTIRIKTQAILNESWIAYEKGDTTITAEVIKWDKSNFLNQEDSVKTIRFTLTDAQQQRVVDPFDGMKIELSKQYGLLNAVNFYHLFYQVSDSYQPLDNAGIESLTLIGMTNPMVGIQNLTWLDVHDFNEGDEIHVKESSLFSDFEDSFAETTELKAYKYLAKTKEENSVTYTVLRSVKLSYASSDTTYENFKKDTVTQTFEPNKSFDVLPYEVYSTEYEASTILMNTTTFIKKYNNHLSFMNSMDSSCWLHEIPICDGYANESYYKGLGGPYFNVNGIEGWNSRELVYYKKGDEVWGSPLAIDKNTSAASFTLYPNPAKELIYINVNTEVHVLEAKVYTIQGQLVKCLALQNNSSVSIADLTRGVYAIQITAGSRSYIQKLVVK